MAKMNDKIVSIVLDKIGISPSELDKYPEEDILALVEKLNNSCAYEYLIMYTYVHSGASGYAAYKGRYEDAKKYAINFFIKEHGAEGGTIEEGSYCTREYPIYTLESRYVRVEVIPKASWIAYKNK